MKDTLRRANSGLFSTTPKQKSNWVLVDSNDWDRSLDLESDRRGGLMAQCETNSWFSYYLTIFLGMTCTLEVDNDVSAAQWPYSLNPEEQLEEYPEGYTPFPTRKLQEAAGEAKSSGLELFLQRALPQATTPETGSEAPAEEASSDKDGASADGSELAEHRESAEVLEGRADRKALPEMDGVEGTELEGGEESERKTAVGGQEGRSAEAGTAGVVRGKPDGSPAEVADAEGVEAAEAEGRTGVEGVSRNVIEDTLEAEVTGGVFEEAASKSIEDGLLLQGDAEVNSQGASPGGESDAAAGTKDSPSEVAQAGGVKQNGAVKGEEGWEAWFPSLDSQAKAEVEVAATASDALDTESSAELSGSNSIKGPADSSGSEAEGSPAQPGPEPVGAEQGRGRAVEGGRPGPEGAGEEGQAMKTADAGPVTAGEHGEDVTSDVGIAKLGALEQKIAELQKYAALERKVAELELQINASRGLVGASQLQAELGGPPSAEGTLAHRMADAGSPSGDVLPGSPTTLDEEGNSLSNTIQAVQQAIQKAEASISKPGNPEYHKGSTAPSFDNDNATEAAQNEEAFGGRKMSEEWVRKFSTTLKPRLRRAGVAYPYGPRRAGVKIPQPGMKSSNFTSQIKLSKDRPGYDSEPHTDGDGSLVSAIYYLPGDSKHTKLGTLVLKSRKAEPSPCPAALAEHNMDEVAADGPKRRGLAGLCTALKWHLTESLVALRDPLESLVALRDPSESLVALCDPSESLVALRDPSESLLALPGDLKQLLGASGHRVSIRIAGKDTDEEETEQTLLTSGVSRVLVEGLLVGRDSGMRTLAEGMLLFKRAAPESLVALRDPSESLVALRDPSESLVALRDPSESLVALRDPSESLVALRDPSESLVALCDPSESLVALRDPSASLVALRGPSESLVALRDPSESLVALRDPSESLEALRDPLATQHIHNWRNIRRLQRDSWERSRVNLLVCAALEPLVVKAMRYIPNSVFAFAPCWRSWHAVKKLDLDESGRTTLQ
eukprot:gene6886-8220_t